jgi:Uma2 family endonuclease
MNTTVTSQPSNNLASKPHAQESRSPLTGESSDNKQERRPTANRWHNIISTNFTIAIGGRIARATCELYANDMQVRLGQNTICYPDVVVVNGEPEFADKRSDVLLNPTVVVEIFSNFGRSNDRTERLEGFLAVPKIKECLLVNETEMRVEHYIRQNAKQWIYKIYDERDDVISLDSIGCKLSLAEVYAQVKLKESELSSKAVN